MVNKFFDTLAFTPATLVKSKNKFTEIYVDDLLDILAVYSKDPSPRRINVKSSDGAYNKLYISTVGMTPLELDVLGLTRLNRKDESTELQIIYGGYENNVQFKKE